jgi:hypothetical protein
MTDRAALLGTACPPQIWRGVLAWSLGAAFYFYAFVHRVSPSIMVHELMRDFAARRRHRRLSLGPARQAQADPDLLLLLADRPTPRRALRTGAAACGPKCAAPRNRLRRSAMGLTFAGGRACNQSAHAGAALGIINTAVMASGAAFQPLIGLFLDLGWDGRMAAGARLYSAADYRMALAVLPVVSALAVVVAMP